MTDEEGSRPPYKEHPLAVTGGILALLSGAVYYVGVSFGYFPNILKILFNPIVGISIGIVFALTLIVGGFLWFRKKGGFGSGQIADQLTKREADRVATRWHRNRGFLAMRTPLDGVDYVESGDDEDHARIYEKIIKPKTDANRKCVLINLEQSVSVDVEDTGSIDDAIMKLNDAVFFSEDAVKDFHTAREDYKEKLAGKSPGETEIVEKPDGSTIRRNVQERTIQDAGQNQNKETVENSS